MDEKQIDIVLDAVKQELLKSNKKFPPFNSTHEGYAVILEEFEEMWDDIKQNLTAHSVIECVQVAAMAVKYIVSVEILNAKE